MLTKNVTIVDEDRFREIMPDNAASEAVEQLKRHIAAFIIESYGAEDLAEIAAFFRTSSGQKMLNVAEEKRLFSVLHRQSPRGGPIDRWRQELPLLERSRFNNFASTQAGKAFVTKTWKVRRSIYYMITHRSRWPELSLDRPYIVEALKTDGVFKFSNRTIRQSLIGALGKNTH